MSEVTVTSNIDYNGVSQAATSPILSIRNVEKVFGGRQNKTVALSGVSFDVNQGEFLSIMGPSGSGKTTLLNCISTIDRATSGRIVVGGNDITSLSKRKLAAFRRNELGFIFQDSNLLDTLTGRENISLALTIKGAPTSDISRRIEEIAVSLGVAGSLDKFPNEMSGGQKQRVAAARAVIGDPTLVLADEPTGALDSRNATVMLETLQMLRDEHGATIIMVTHDAYAASYSDRVLFLSDGRIFNEIYKGSLERQEYFTRIMEVVSFLGGEAYHAV